MSKFWCCAVPVLLLALAAGCLQMALKQPHISKAVVEKIVEVGGIPDTIWNHIQVTDESAWYDMITKANLGVGEGYMHGKIQLEPLNFFLTLLNGTSIGTRRKEGSDMLGVVMDTLAAPTKLAGYFANMQSRERSTRVTKDHYNAGNDLYERMMGPSMSYTCAYWRKGARNLDEAQADKLNLVMRKLQLEPGMKVADIGTGWGTAAAYMVEHGNVDVTGVSLQSEEQVKFSANLKGPNLRFIRQDYRDHCDDPKYIGAYDRVYSMGMLEHVGFKNHATYFKCIKKLLKPDGLAVIHSIGEPDFVPASDPFLDKYIFPGAVIPALSSLAPAIENYFIVEDFHNFGFDYALTLEAWDVNAKAFFREHPDRYSAEFQRMWEYYLKMCEALFRLRINQLWQFVLSPRPATRQGIDRQL